MLNQHQNSDKVPFIIYADLEGLIEKIDGCENNPDNLSTTKVGDNIPSDFSMSIIWSFKSIERRHDVYREKDCWKKFSKSLRKHAMEIIIFKNNKREVINKGTAEIM